MWQDYLPSCVVPHGTATLSQRQVRWKVHEWIVSAMPESISYDVLLKVLFQRSIAELAEDELVYFLDLVQRLRDLKERTETEAWWFRYYC
jgi:hypothetical protein